MTEQPVSPVLAYVRRIDGWLERVEGELQDVRRRLGDELPGAMAPPATRD